MKTRGLPRLLSDISDVLTTASAPHHPIRSLHGRLIYLP